MEIYNNSDPMNQIKDTPSRELPQLVPGLPNSVPHGVAD